jgi:hypothetical protein
MLALRLEGNLDRSELSALTSGDAHRECYVRDFSVTTRCIGSDRQTERTGTASFK